MNRDSTIKLFIEKYEEDREDSIVLPQVRANGDYIVKELHAVNSISRVSYIVKDIEQVKGNLKEVLDDWENEFYEKFEPSNI